MVIAASARTGGRGPTARPAAQPWLEINARNQPPSASPTTGFKINQIRLERLRCGRSKDFSTTSWRDTLDQNFLQVLVNPRVLRGFRKRRFRKQHYRSRTLLNS